jgi:hypothetical protein
MSFYRQLFGTRQKPPDQRFEQVAASAAALAVPSLRGSSAAAQFVRWLSKDYLGGIMAVQAIVDSAEHSHLFGDVAALLLVAVVLAVLIPRGVALMQE